MRAGLVVGALVLATGVACGDEVAGSPAREQPTEFIARALVLEDEGHGPQLCLGGVLDSLPPQCGGPDLVGWNWSELTGYDTQRGVSWGDYVVIGSYDPEAEEFTPTREPIPADDYHGPYFQDQEPEPTWTTPCPEPEGGWRVLDPALTTDQSQSRTGRIAQARSDFGQLWVDQSINPALYDGFDPEDEWAMNDPKNLVLNISVTGDLEEAEAQFRETWGGALCVSHAEHTDRELQTVQNELVDAQIELLSSGQGRDVVEVGVVWDDGSLQAGFDEKYGEGTVAVSSALQPFEE